jgi:GT2 family glycosyltransferase/2-polyprenyl-3-methyl-5-hydroxy-6-metoxy-1,4-benzoquinol methylase
MDEKISSKRYGQTTIIDLNNKNLSPTLIVEFVGVNKKVLEIGTSTGYISKILKERGNIITGIEIDPEAGLVAQEYCNQMILGDVETIDLDKKLELGSFNVILCGDVLEHLKNPTQIIKKIRKLLAPDGYLIVSLPNFCHGDVLLNIMNSDFRYTPVGLLDETHLRFFGLKNIFALFAECGYQIKDIRTTKIDIGNTELAINQKRIPPDLLNFIKSLPNSNVYQFIFTAFPSENITNPIIEEIDIAKLFSEALVESRKEIEAPLLKELKKSDQQLHEMMVQKQILESENSQIKRSATWKFVSFFHGNIVEKIFPPNTNRREKYDFGVKGVNVLVNEGYYAFCTKVFHYISGKKYHKKVKNLSRFTNLKKSEERLGITNNSDNFLTYTPKISIITPVYNVNEKYLTECIESVLQQTYINWEFCLVDDASDKKFIPEILKKYQAKDSRIKVKFNEKNLGISETTNAAINIATGEFIAFLDNDDLLTKNALFEIVALLNEHKDADVIYSDQDKITKTGKFCEPFYKPDWSPEYFRGVMYIGHLLTVRKSLAENVGLMDKTFDSIQDYEFMLRLSETTKKIYHIPKILYTWRKSEGSIASNADSKGNISEKQVKAVNSQLKRIGLQAIASPGPFPHRVVITPLPRSHFPLVSIIIPTKDKPELIERCLKSIYDLTSYPNFEVIVIDNNSTDEHAKSIINSFPCRKLFYNEPFNFSKINNLGATQANGEYLVFLNNDTRIQSKKWIEFLLYYAEQPDIAAVGPLLIFPNNKVQHAGVVLGFRGTADHIMRDYPSDCDGYAGSLSCAREVSAVTAACMMVKKSVFLSVEGFNEHYSNIYQDVDLCLKFSIKGYRIIFNPRVIITHYECSTRDKKYYDLIDRNLLLDQWEEIIERGDKYYNCNFDVTKYGSGNTGYKEK